MKKGCFLTALLLFTILVGVVVYIVKYKGNFLKEFSKDKIADLAMFQLDKKLKDVKASVYKDSLVVEIQEFFKRNNNMPFDSAMTRLQDVMDEARFFIHDGKIDSLDFYNLKIFLTRYERSKKN